MKTVDVNLSDQISVAGFRSLNPQEQANIINTAFLAPFDDYLDYLTIIVAEGEVITSPYSMSLRRSECRLVITEPEATNCFSIHFQAFTRIIN